jgi:glutaredoxin
LRNKSYIDCFIFTFTQHFNLEDNYTFFRFGIFINKTIRIYIKILIILGSWHIAIVYGKKNCVFCDRAIRLLSGIGAKVEYHDVGITEIRERLLELVPSAKTVPQIWLNGSFIGGCDDLIQYLESSIAAMPVPAAEPTSAFDDWDINYGQDKI